ncbi:hypothetical protein Ancab_016837 [Ancistrocladus abbreviatus]
MNSFVDDIPDPENQCSYVQHLLKVEVQNRQALCVVTSVLIEIELTVIKACHSPTISTPVEVYTVRQCCIDQIRMKCNCREEQGDEQCSKVLHFGRSDDYLHLLPLFLDS